MTYRGIDYGNWQSNRDIETNIRYGFIHQNKLSSWAWDDMLSHGDDLDFADMKQASRMTFGQPLNEFWRTMGLSVQTTLADWLRISSMTCLSMTASSPLATAHAIATRGTATSSRRAAMETGCYSRASITLALSSAVAMPPGAGSLAKPCEDGPRPTA